MHPTHRKRGEPQLEHLNEYTVYRFANCYERSNENDGRF